MYQFTREFIINDNVGKLTGGKKFYCDDNTLFVDNMINLRKQDVHAIYKHAYEPEVKEKVTIKAAVFGDVAVNDQIRLVITLGQRGKVTATFNDVWPDHSRQLFYETIAETAAAADVIDGLLASVAGEANLRGEKFVSIVKDTDDLAIEALDCYTTIKEVRIVKLPKSVDSNVGPLLTGFEDWDPMLIWKRKDGTVANKVVFVAGAEGNGNTVQILKNMRLQTAANLNPYGLNMDERPLPKGQYDQYTVELVTERHNIGHDVVGSVGTSLTTHVFYVLAADAACTCASDSVSDAFATELGKLCAIKTAKSVKEAKRVLAHTSDLPAEAESSSDGE